MIAFSRASRRLLAPMMILPLLAAPLPAYGAPARKAVARKPAVAADAGIIALPLAPIVPAAQRLCAARTPAGLGYTMLRPASGEKPAAGATVLVNYIGYLAATGAVFDQGMRTPLPVDEVIPGFSQGLRMLAKTGIVRLCVPAAMGYGPRESGPIPANSDLVFQVELLDFRTAAQMEEMRKAQEAAAAAPAPSEAAPQPPQPAQPSQPQPPAVQPQP